MNLKMIISRSIGTRFGLSNILSARSYATAVKSETAKQQTESGVLEYDEVPVYEKEEDSEERINRLRNKSRLNPADYNRLHEKKPYTKSMEWYHDTVKYKKKMFGRYGLKSLDVTAGIAWPTKDAVEDAKEYERVAYPLSLQECWKLIEEKKQAKAEEIRNREMEIEQKLQNMGKWKADLDKKIAQKEATELAAREKKERMIEEIRRYYGVNISPKSPKFKELLDKKEEEEKKKKKAMKKEEKAAKAMQKINQQLELANAYEKPTKEASSKDNKEANNPQLDKTNNV